MNHQNTWGIKQKTHILLEICVKNRGGVLKNKKKG